MALVAFPPVSAWALGSGVESFGGGAGARLANLNDAKLLLHGEGGTIVDSSPAAHAVSAGGSAALSSAQKKFGSKSLYIPGASDYFTSANSADWRFDGDFTIDLQAYFSGFNANGYNFVVAQAQDGSNQWGFYLDSSAHKMYFFSYATTHLITFSVPWTPSIGTWYHLAVERYGNTWNIFIDGTAGSKTLVDGSYSCSIPSLTSALSLGGQGINATYGMKGYLDEVRISKGIARYQGGNFTAPTAAYSDYSSSSPVAESPWMGSPYKTLDASAAISMFEGTLGGAGNIKYQYALNNGSYNGTWKTMAELNTALSGATITNPSNSLRLKAQLNGDGTQVADLVPGCITASDLDYPAVADVKSGVGYGIGQYTGTYSGGGGSCDYPAVADVRSGVQFNGGASTGLLDLPAIANVRQGTSFDHNTKTGTAYIPAAADVRSGVNVDASVGSCHVPGASDVRHGVAIDATTGTAYIPAAADVRSGVNVDASTGLLDLPAIANVRLGTSFDHNTKTGTAYIPAAADVRSGVNVDATVGSAHIPSAPDTRFGVDVDATTGTCKVPAASDVREGVAVDVSDTGLLDLPAEADVRDGVGFDRDTKTGTYAPTACDYPAASDVRASVTYDHGTLTGTLLTGEGGDYPAPDDVRKNVAYANGSLTGEATLKSIAPAPLTGFRDVEAAIISALKLNVPALRTVEPWAGQIADRLDSLTVPLPAAFVSYGGSGFQPIDGPSHREEATFTVIVASRSMRADGSERTGATGAYALVQDVLAALSNEDFGYAGMERLTPARVALIASEGGAAVYGITLQTAFDTQYDW